MKEDTLIVAGLLSLLIIFGFMVAVPGRSREGVKVDLEDTQKEGIIQIQQTEPPGQVFYFGFDLRLSPQEEVEIYLTFLEYLSEKTGYTFKIRFTTNYESTQENLGKGVTQFAALGALSYIQALERDGVVPIARGLNEKGKDGTYVSKPLTGFSAMMEKFTIKPLNPLRQKLSKIWTWKSPLKRENQKWAFFP